MRSFFWTWRRSVLMVLVPGAVPAVREFARCDVRLPDGLPPLPAGVDPALVRNMLQQMLDERCGTLMAGR